MSAALGLRALPHTFGQQLIELLRLSRVVLHQTRIEPGHQQMVFRESGAHRSQLCWKLRAIRKDAVSSIRDMETCATTSTFRPHSRLRPGTSTSADLSPFTRSVRVLCSAGARPQRSALNDGQCEARQQHARVHPERNGDRQLGWES